MFTRWGNRPVLPGTNDPETTEVLQENHYYPFGMQMMGGWMENPGRENEYQYNGKELNQDLSLNWLDYGARWYDPAIGRFTGVDPISDQFPHVSTYNYAENEPVGSIDLWGLQKVSVNDIRNSKGEITRRNVTVSVNMQVLNLSSKENYEFNSSSGNAISKSRSSFNTSFTAQVLDNESSALTANEVPVNVNFNLSVGQVSSIDRVQEIDFVSMIVDKIDTDVSDNAVGIAVEGVGNILLIEASSFADSPEILLHELGHNLGLDHTKDGKGLMGEKMNKDFSVDRSLLKLMHLGLGVGGKNSEARYPNTKSNSIDFLKENTGRYDEKKAKSAGFN